MHTFTPELQMNQKKKRTKRVVSIGIVGKKKTSVLEHVSGLEADDGELHRGDLSECVASLMVGPRREFAVHTLGAFLRQKLVLQLDFKTHWVRLLKMVVNKFCALGLYANLTCIFYVVFRTRSVYSC
jgi:hypothetical protein